MGMATEPPSVMGRRRAILTDSERELLAAEDLDDENRRYQAVSRVRNKIDDELPQDVSILKENHSQLLQELREVVCDDAGAAEAEISDIRNAVREAREAYEDVDGNGVEDAIARLEELTGVSDGG